MNLQFWVGSGLRRRRYRRRHCRHRHRRHSRQWRQQQQQQQTNGHLKITGLFLSGRCRYVSLFESSICATSKKKRSGRPSGCFCCLPFSPTDHCGKRNVIKGSLARGTAMSTAAKATGETNTTAIAVTVAVTLTIAAATAVATATAAATATVAATAGGTAATTAAA